MFANDSFWQFMYQFNDQYQHQIVSSILHFLWIKIAIPIIRLVSRLTSTKTVKLVSSTPSSSGLPRTPKWWCVSGNGGERMEWWLFGVVVVGYGNLKGCPYG